MVVVLENAHQNVAVSFVSNERAVAQEALLDKAAFLVAGNCAEIVLQDDEFDTVQPQLVKRVAKHETGGLGSISPDSRRSNRTS